MRLKRTGMLLLTLALLLTFAVSCGEKAPAGTVTTAGGSTPSVSTASTTGAEGGKEEPPIDYPALMDFAFSDAATAPESDFSWSVSGGSVSIDRYNGGANKVRVPDSIDGKPVRVIGNGAFAENTALTVLILPDGVTAVGTSVLAGCTELYALRTPLLGANASSEQYLGYLFGADRYADNPRDVPPSLYFLDLAGGLTALPEFALLDCNDLLALRLPESVRSVGAYACYQCAKLESVNLSSVETIGESAFRDCAKLGSVTLGSGLTSVGLGAFEGCGSIREMVLPFVGGTRTEKDYLGYLFGAEYPDFTAGFVPAALKKLTVTEGCTSLGNNAFFECSTIREIVLPSTVQTIGTRAFYRCRALTSLTLPASLRTIGDNAFTGCTGLKSVTFGENLGYLGVNAFYGCSALRAVSLPESLSSLPASAFADCSALSEVDLGGVTEVGAQAFRNCTALKSVTSAHSVRFEKGNDLAERCLNGKPD